MKIADDFGGDARAVLADVTKVDLPKAPKHADGDVLDPAPPDLLTPDEPPLDLSGSDSAYRVDSEPLERGRDPRRRAVRRPDHVEAHAGAARHPRRARARQADPPVHRRGGARGVAAVRSGEPGRDRHADPVQPRLPRRRQVLHGDVRVRPQVRVRHARLAVRVPRPRRRDRRHRGPRRRSRRHRRVHRQDPGAARTGLSRRRLEGAQSLAVLGAQAREDRDVPRPGDRHPRRVVLDRRQPHHGRRRKGPRDRAAEDARRERHGRDEPVRDPGPHDRVDRHRARRADRPRRVLGRQALRPAARPQRLLHRPAADSRRAVERGRRLAGRHPDLDRRHALPGAPRCARPPRGRECATDVANREN